jgi:outer membrane protein OmpA-like peptidoglycan-associated protein
MRPSTIPMPPRLLPRTGVVLAAALLGLALPAAAAPGSRLELYLGPHESDWLELRSLRVLLDGTELPVTLPPRGADPAQPIYSGAVGPGAHELRVEAGLDGDSQVFTYVEEYRFAMRGQIAVEAPAAEVVAVQARVTSSAGPTTQWVDRYRLSLRAAHYPSDHAAAIEEPDRPVAGPPATAPPAEQAADLATPSVNALPGAPPPGGSAGRCALEPVRFAFASAKLTEAGRAALDGFAACLRGTSGVVRLDGHADPQGPADYNEWLGERRARAAAARLAAQGVPRSRITTRTFGETKPVCTAPGPACNSRNRRVEAVLAD